jgi:hypothetical protein
MERLFRTKIKAAQKSKLEKTPQTIYSSHATHLSVLPVVIIVGSKNVSSRTG